MLNDTTPKTRLRFTTAHEICHTFFYETVPELKFHPHPTDPLEEAVCNHGAAALLMPAEDALHQVKNKDVSLATLEEFAKRYDVSIETAFLRLRGLKVWNCEMTVWHRMMTGSFVVDKVHGWLRRDWRWVESSIPHRAWSEQRGNAIRGRSFVYCETASGLSAAKPVYFELKRRGESLVAIWGAKRLGTAIHVRGLFGTRKSDIGPRLRTGRS